MWGRNGLGEASSEEGAIGYPSLGISPSPATALSLLVLESHFFFPLFGKNIGFLLEGGQFGCRASGAPLTVSVVSAAGCMQGFHISLLLFMNIIFFLHAHSSFQTFGQAAPRLVQAWVWLQRCLFFLFCFD